MPSLAESLHIIADALAALAVVAGIAVLCIMRGA